MIRPTASMTAKVSKYWISLTAIDSRGGTKKKSNDATPRKVVRTAGPRPNITATTTTASRNSITILTGSKYGRSSVPTTVGSTQATPAQPSAGESWVDLAAGPGV